MNTKKTRLLGLICVLSLLLSVILFFWHPSNAPIRHSSVPLTLKSEPSGGDFSVEILNADLSLKDLRGKLVILYFGYTQCPDICPITLSHITTALNMMTESELEAVQALFISIDPERDNTARLEEYSQYFHKKLLGATTEPDNILTIAERYGVAYEFIETDLAPAYVINHSSAVYIIDSQGRLVRSLPYGADSEVILNAVREQLGRKR